MEGKQEILAKERNREDSGVKNAFSLTGRVAVITGGAGLLGKRYAHAIAEMGGIPVLIDIHSESVEIASKELSALTGKSVYGVKADITKKREIEAAVKTVLNKYGKIDILINNAALTMKGKINDLNDFYAPFESYPEEHWQAALDVNLTGTFLVTQAIGRIMRDQGSGVIVNISSDVGSISPDHRIYAEQQFNTPIAYSTTKGAILSFTRYLATYWAKFGVRVNAISPAGVYESQDPKFVKRLTELIPLGRMANKDEYSAAIIFLVSDASSFMTGANLIIDGGRTCW